MKKCPQCDLNYIKDDADFCEVCKPQSIPIQFDKVIETDFGIIRSGRNYGTGTPAIYEKFCKTLGWDFDQLDQFGRNKPLFAYKADANRKCSIWFLFHSNITGTKPTSKRTSSTANGEPHRNIIKLDYSSMTENVRDDEDKQGFDGVPRIVFAKNKYDGYEFIGVFQMVKYENYTRYYERISDTYPI